MRKVLEAVSNENDRETSAGEQITTFNNKLHSPCENQRLVFLGLLKGPFLKSWSEREEMRPRHLLTKFC